MSRRRAGRVSLACATVGVLSLATGAVGMLSAHADAPPGSGLGALNLVATASGVRMPMYNTGDGGEDVEGIAPYATAQMQSGNVGHALTSVMWPGDTGGNGGSTLQLLGPICVPPNPMGLVPGVPCVATVPVPDQVYQDLNDPEKAEAQSGVGQPTTTVSRPWGTMTATATSSKVLADTTILGSKELPTGDTFGETNTTTTITLTGPKTAVVDAVSTVRNIDLGGVIKISSIVSTAHGTTNGTTASGTAHTIVAGATIAGIPVTIDENGVHAGGQGSSLSALDQVNSALKNAGFAIYVAAPTRTLAGSGVTLDAGSLIITQNNPQYTGNANATGRMLVLGGVGVIAQAGLGYPAADLTLPAITSAFTPPGQPQAATGPGGSMTVPGTPAGASAPAPSGQQPAFAPVVAGQRSPLPGGLPAGWIVLVVLGGLLAAAGLRRLPDRLFATAATPCPLGETR